PRNTGPVDILTVVTRSKITLDQLDGFQKSRLDGGARRNTREIDHRASGAAIKRQPWAGARRVTVAGTRINGVLADLHLIGMGGRGTRAVRGEVRRGAGGGPGIGKAQGEK